MMDFWTICVSRIFLIIWWSINETRLGKSIKSINIHNMWKVEKWIIHILSCSYGTITHFYTRHDMSGQPPASGPPNCGHEKSVPARYGKEKAQ